MVEKREMSSAADRQLISVGAIGIVQHLLTKVASNMNRPVGLRSLWPACRLAASIICLGYSARARCAAVTA